MSRVVATLCRPPVAGPLHSGPLESGWKTIPSRPHAAPRGAGASHSVAIVPLAISIARIVPPAKKPSRLPSGDQNGWRAPAVPGSARTSSRARRRSHSPDGPAPRAPTSASVRPSGEIATSGDAGSVMKSDGAAIETMIVLGRGSTAIRRVATTPTIEARIAIPIWKDTVWLLGFGLPGPAALAASALPILPAVVLGRDVVELAWRFLPLLGPPPPPPRRAALRIEQVAQHGLILVRRSRGRERAAQLLVLLRHQRLELERLDARGDRRLLGREAVRFGQHGVAEILEILQLVLLPPDRGVETLDRRLVLRLLGDSPLGLAGPDFLLHHPRPVVGVAAQAPGLRDLRAGGNLEAEGVVELLLDVGGGPRHVDREQLRHPAVHQRIAGRGGDSRGGGLRGRGGEVGGMSPG